MVSFNIVLYHRIDDGREGEGSFKMIRKASVVTI